MRVLIADDDATTRLVEKAVIQKLGHDCIVANDGDAAWAILQSQPVDVLITDWVMPGLDGLELCRRLRAREADTYTYTILATAMSERADVLAGMEAGADDFLVKPIDPFAVQTRLIAAARVTGLHNELNAFRAQLERANGNLAEQARTDPLTQLGNRLRLEEDLYVLHSAARRHGRAYSIVMCDIDHFKAYNDTYGHPQGDDTLQRVASVFAVDKRAGDTAYRYGGEEFILLLADALLPGAVIAVERLRQSVEDLAIVHTGNAPAGVVTISAGIATYEPGLACSSAEILEQADEALYCAKREGRNRVATSGITVIH
ncbi:MAG TPA: diguanylate cyclase [Acidimicrobiia bacterium]|jgi:two-component system chemotaxis response regulator CheY|nr:diguanylate cyclase [Acidimicrobiia bacterium]